MRSSAIALGNNPAGSGAESSVEIKGDGAIGDLRPAKMNPRGCSGCLAEGGDAQVSVKSRPRDVRQPVCSLDLLTLATSRRRATSGKWATQQEEAQDSVMMFLSFVPFPILY